MRILVVVFSLLVIIHGLIHLLGVVKAFRPAAVSQLTQDISRPVGMLWLLCALLFTTAGILLLFRQDSWWWFALPAVLLSQGLIIASWSDAKYGTIANIIILIPLILALIEALPGSYSHRYQAAVRDGLAHSAPQSPVTEADLQHLPAPVQRYLRYTGAVGKPRVQNVRVVFTGDFRNGLNSPWMTFRSEQYNFTDPPARYFLMKGAVNSLPAQGLHLFDQQGATFQIKVASLFQVVDAKGPQMDQGETVTFFNDLCLLAPAALIDKERIQWHSINPQNVQAKFTHRGTTISAVLTFNKTGELVNFVSDDRFLSTDGKTYTSYPWSTPVRGYREINGRKVMSYGEASWRLPEGEFTYGKFNLAEIEYNVSN